MALNRAGGPWQFWVEMKGHSTAIKRTKIDREKNRAGAQAAWAYRQIAAGVSCYLLRTSRALLPLLEYIEFPHELRRSMGTDSATGEPIELETCGGIWRPLPEKENEKPAQDYVKKILEWHGFTVTDTSQGYRPGGKRHGNTRITLGTHDLWCVHPALELPDPGLRWRDKQEKMDALSDGAARLKYRRAHRRF